MAHMQSPTQGLCKVIKRIDGTGNAIQHNVANFFPTLNDKVLDINVAGTLALIIVMADTLSSWIGVGAGCAKPSCCVRQHEDNLAVGGLLARCLLRDASPASNSQMGRANPIFTWER
jgi:hypothetical protein